MALYEGIALIQEKQAVVLDLGTEYTKFGFTGEPAPRCIVRSEFWCTTERRYKKVHDYSSPEELYDNLVHMLHTLYFRHVLVNPKERKVVVVESLLTPTLFRETLAKVLFSHYEVSGVVWADSPRLCALTLGTPITLVVSIGAKEAEVAAVVHSCVVLQALQAQPLGAHALHAELARLLDEDNGTQLNLPDHVIEDIKVKTCFVGSRSRAEQWASDNKPTPARDVLHHRVGAHARARRRGALYQGQRVRLAARYCAAVHYAVSDRQSSCAGGQHPGDGRRRRAGGTRAAPRRRAAPSRHAGPIQVAPARERVQVPLVADAGELVRVGGRRAVRRGRGGRGARAAAGRVRARAPPARLGLPARQHAARAPGQAPAPHIVTYTHTQPDNTLKIKSYYSIPSYA